MPSPVVAKSRHDDVAALLAAEDEAARAHRLEHVAITDAGLDDGDARLPHGELEAEVRHHRGHDGVVGSAPRAVIAVAMIARMWSPSTSAPVASTARQRSASPS